MKVTKDMIDPQLRFMGKMTDRIAGSRNLTVEKARKTVESPSLMTTLLMKMLVKPKGIRIDEQWIPREDGSKMRILVMGPLKPKKDVLGLLNLHGGGYFAGSAEMGFSHKPYIDASDCVIVAPEYRLGFEAPYPAALEDCYTALLWMKDNADSLGIRDDQIAVAGESAGGGLTAATTLYARDKGEVNVAFQMPLYPMLDDRNNTDSARDNDAPVWNSVTNEVGWKIYLGDLWGTDDVPPYAAPARATDYSGLPPTYTYVGSVEPFHDETVTYVENLKAAGVPAEIDVYEGAWHGFTLVKKADVTKTANQRHIQWFKKAVSQYFAQQPGKGESPITEA